MITNDVRLVFIRNLKIISRYMSALGGRSDAT